MHSPALPVHAVPNPTAAAATAANGLLASPDAVFMSFQDTTKIELSCRLGSVDNVDFKTFAHRVTGVRDDLCFAIIVSVAKILPLLIESS